MKARSVALANLHSARIQAYTCTLDMYSAATVLGGARAARAREIAANIERELAALKRLIRLLEKPVEETGWAQ